MVWLFNWSRHLLCLQYQILTMLTGLGSGSFGVNISMRGLTHCSGIALQFRVRTIKNNYSMSAPAINSQSVFSLPEPYSVKYLGISCLLQAYSCICLSYDLQIDWEYLDLSQVVVKRFLARIFTVRIYGYDIQDNLMRRRKLARRIDNRFLPYKS